MGIEKVTTAHPSSAAPIYEDLVREQGDVPAEARRAADEFRRKAAEALDWRLPPAPRR